MHSSMYPTPAIVARLLLAAQLFLALIVPCVVEARPISVAVIYPDVAPPYNTVLDKIISGIKKQADINVKEYPLSDGYDSAALREKLERYNTEVIITLGRRGTEAVQELRWEKPIIVGAASLTPSFMNAYGKSISAIRLIPDPDLLFAKLRQFSPQSKRIIVITNVPQGSGSVTEGRVAITEQAWLLSAAHEAAKKHGFELVIHPATDMRMTTGLYLHVIDNMKPESDALWLPPDDESIDIRGILPAILQGAWDRRVIVFSSNPAYAKRGALFALYPDNIKTGQQLAALAMDVVKSGLARIIPTRDVLTAVNMRTAEHLELREIAQQKFDAMYPSP